MPELRQVQHMQQVHTCAPVERMRELQGMGFATFWLMRSMGDPLKLLPGMLCWQIGGQRCPCHRILCASGQDGGMRPCHYFPSLHGKGCCRQLHTCTQTECVLVLPLCCVCAAAPANEQEFQAALVDFLRSQVCTAVSVVMNPLATMASS